MRLTRLLWLPLVAVAACDHDQIAEIVTHDGEGVIPVIDLNTAAFGGYPTGGRAINLYVLTVDTTVPDAFARSSANPARFIADRNAIYGSTPLVYGPGATGATFTPPNRLLPALVPEVRVPTPANPLFARAFSPFAAPNANAVAYIVSGDHPGNGVSGSWEFWYEFNQLSTGRRHILGLARYAVQVRGALDHAEILMRGVVGQPDSLVFMAGDFNPGGTKGNVNGYINDCNDAAEGQPVAGANPYFIGGAVGAAAGRTSMDHTVCSAGVWADAYAVANSPVPPNNNTALGPNQYNFIVLWEALPDSTPNYARPVFRQQIGPLVTTAGAVINNAYAPVPIPALPALNQAALADTIRFSATTLFTLSAGNSYSLWLTRAGTDSAVKVVAGRVIRINPADTTQRDTLATAGDFNVTAPRTSVRVELDYLDYDPAAWNAAVLAIGPTGSTTLPADQPLWALMTTRKNVGDPVPSFASNAIFGSFNKGMTPLIYGSAGTATGGIFGRELREDIKRIPRPPMGFDYEVYLAHSTDSTPPVSLGPLLTPYPELLPLTNADTRTAAPLSGVEITQAAARFISGTAAFYCAYDRVQVRLKARAASGIPTGILLSGANPRRGC